MCQLLIDNFVSAMSGAKGAGSTTNAMTAGLSLCVGLTILR